MTCAALSGEVASDVRDVLLQPFLTNKNENLKGILIERRSLTTPERVNKVFSGEKMGSNILSGFLRRLQKTAGFGTTAVVGKAVIRQAFIRRMPVSIRAHLATQPNSASLENLSVFTDRALAFENDVEELEQGVAEIQVSKSAKLVGMLEDLSRRLKKLETATAKKKSYGHKQTPENRVSKTLFVPNAQAKPFIPNNQNGNRQVFFTNVQQASRLNIPPPNRQKNSAAQPIDTHITKHSVIKHARADKPARFFKLVGQSKVATLASGEITETRHDSAEATLPTLSPSKLLYGADKRNKCKYLIETGVAVSILHKFWANRTTDTTSLPLVAANNTTITTYGTSKRIVDVGLKREYAWI